MKRITLFTVMSALMVIGLVSCFSNDRSNGNGTGKQATMSVTPLPDTIKTNASGITATPFHTKVKAENGSVTVIPLSGPITSKDAELSGLAWAGETLVLLPQYPERFGPGDGALFAIPKSEILNYLDGKSKSPITPSLITFVAPGVKESIKKYEGYEAIDFLDQTVYMTIESGKNDKMMGYLVSGSVSSDLKEIRIDTSHLVKIQPAIQMDNRTDEAVVVMQDKLLTFFEINGADLNPRPAAHVFGFDLSPKGTIPFPQLEYRVTDATLAPDGGIWVINYVAPKDSDVYPTTDPLAGKYGQGEYPDKNRQVERLVKLNLSDEGLTLADQPPLQIPLINSPRNWEGLVLLDDRGFLLVTDKSPGTMLGFVSLPR